MDEFWTLLEAQGKTTNAIDTNLSEAGASVLQGAAELALAHKYKTAMYPVAGAVIGGVIAGPLGLFTGIKLAGLVSAVAGTYIGFKGGSVWRRRLLMTAPLIPAELKPNESGNTEEDVKKRN